jgi:hypothetical protein
MATLEPPKEPPNKPSEKPQTTAQTEQSASEPTRGGALAVIVKPDEPKSEASRGGALAVIPKSRWYRFRAGVARRPWLLQVPLLLLVISGTGLFLMHSLFKGAWSQHRDNFAILRTIFVMELSRDDALALKGDSQQVITRAYGSLEPYLATDGWVWINRFGSTITYGREDQRLIASCSPYSPLYLICDLSEIP